MEVTQAVNNLSEGAVLESVEGLKTALASQTTLIYVMIAIAAVSLLIAWMALRKSGGTKRLAPSSAAPAPASIQAAAPSASHPEAVVAAITAAISCVLEQERSGQTGSIPPSGFVVRRIRRV